MSIKAVSFTYFLSDKVNQQYKKSLFLVKSGNTDRDFKCLTWIKI